MEYLDKPHKVCVRPQLGKGRSVAPLVMKVIERVPTRAQAKRFARERQRRVQARWYYSHTRYGRRPYRNPRYLGKLRPRVEPLPEDEPRAKKLPTVEDREFERQMLQKIAAMRVAGVEWRQIDKDLGFRAFHWAATNRRERWLKILDEAWLEKADELRAKAEDRLDKLGADAEEEKIQQLANNSLLQHVDRVRGQTIRLTVDRAIVGAPTDSARAKLDELMPQELDGTPAYADEESLHLLDGTPEQEGKEVINDAPEAETAETADAEAAAPASEGGEVSPAEMPVDGGEYASASDGLSESGTAQDGQAPADGHVGSLQIPGERTPR